MFERTPEGLYRSSLLGAFPWIAHGFSTRLSDGWPGEYASLRQIHSDRVAIVECGAIDHDQGDALITKDPGGWLGVRTADCVPILLADPENRAIGAVHAGWRGTVAAIVWKTVESLIENFRSDPRKLVAAIGPSIGQCCFAVGDEVAVQFESLFPEGVRLDRIDLVEANRRQLLKSGVPATNIDVANLCTMCLVEQFHSWRRDREGAGRMVSAIGIRA